MLLTRSRLGPPVTLKTHKLEPLLESSSFTEQGCERKECSTSPLQPVPQCFIPPAPFSIQIYLLRLDSFPFHPICLSSSSVQNTVDIFHISVLALPTSLKASSVPPMTFSEVRFSSLITTSSSCWADTLPAISPWFSCRALWVRIQPDFPSAWCHFIFGCTSCKRKGEKKGGKNTFSRNRSKECKLTAMKSVRRDEESVPPHISNHSGQRVWKGVWKSYQTAGSRFQASFNSLWTGYVERRRASVCLIKLQVMVGAKMMKINPLIIIKSPPRLLLH